jgi:hypothetical protein
MILKFYILICCLVLSLFQLNAQISRPIGTNLSSIQDWSSEYVFVDVFDQCREWIPHEYGSGAPWSSGVTIPLGTNGYPLEIPFNNGIDPPQATRTLMFFGDLANKYPSGNYRLLASGSGQISLRFASIGTFSCPVDTLVWVDSSLGGIALEIDTSLVSDPVRDIHFIMPGFENSYPTNPYNPDLISFMDDFQVIRFMDWMETNGSSNTLWSDRNTSDFYSQTLDNGVGYEHIVRICNTTGKNPWICVPHRANDQYISELAKLFRDSLDPELKIYIEYSNEVWNGSFAQNQYADSMGNVMGYPGNPWEQGWQYYAKRTADVMRIFENEFQDNSRLVKVISSQASNSWITNYIIEKFKDPLYNPTQVQADAIAIAPYFGGSVANDIGNAGLINSVSVDDILDSLELSLPTAYAWMDANKVVADTHNLELIAYEGGQHLVANATYYNDTAYVNKLMDANRHPRMEDLYCNYLNYWFDSAQAGLFCNFSSHGVYSKYGSWGIKEFMDDTLSPKYLGLQNCAFSYNSDTTSTKLVEYAKIERDIQVFPVPSINGLIRIKHNLNSPDLFLYDNAGRSINFKIIKNDAFFMLIDLNNYKGVGTVLLIDDGHFASDKIVLIE